jgi:hypothetical protein
MYHLNTAGSAASNISFSKPGSSINFTNDRLETCRNLQNNAMKDDKPIITEDGQRLTIDNGQITGTENPGPGLAFETGNVLDEQNKPGSSGSCPTDNARQKSDQERQ